MASSRPVNFGATIVTSQPENNVALHLPQQHLDSPNLTPVPSFDGSREPPATSPFYEHPAASREFSHSRHSSKHVGADEKDLESGNLTPASPHDENPFTSQISVDCNKECKMWPSKQTLMQARKEQKKQRRVNRTCAPMRDRWSLLTKKQRLLIKIATALFVIGIAVAIGVGISVAVGGGYYSSDGSSRQIPHN